MLTFDECLAEPPEAKCFSAGLGDFNDRPAEAHGARRNREVSGQAIYEALDYRLKVTAEAGVVGTAHSDIANKCRSARENALVGCLDMGMGA